MKSDLLELALLFDCYGSTLTEKQRVCFDLYCNQDFSLSEIADEAGISRQGVHDTLARTETALRQMEEQLGCVRREQRLREAAALLRQTAGELETRSDPAADAVLRAAKLITND